MAMKITKIFEGYSDIEGMFLGEVSRKYALPQGIGSGINSERGGTRSFYADDRRATLDASLCS